MASLTRATRELFRRSPDERFASLPDLLKYCLQQRKKSLDCWQPPQNLVPTPVGEQLCFSVGTDDTFALNDWRFSQHCRMARIPKDTLNRLTAESARRVLTETMPGDKKATQILRSDQTNAGDRSEADQKVSTLLALAT